MFSCVAVVQARAQRPLVWPFGAHPSRLPDYFQFADLSFLELLIAVCLCGCCIRFLWPCPVTQATSYVWGTLYVTRRPLELRLHLIVVVPLRLSSTMTLPSILWDPPRLCTSQHPTTLQRSGASQEILFRPSVCPLRHQSSRLCRRLLLLSPGLCFPRIGVDQLRSRQR